MRRADKMDYLKIIKAGFIAVGTAINAFLGNLAAPVYILLLMGFADYITGVIAAPYRGEIRNTYKGLRGIAKKVCILLLVGVGAAVDWLIAYTVQSVGITPPVSLVAASLVAIWLICNEILSILENVGDIGINLPPFLTTLVQWVKQSAGDKGDMR